MIKYTDEQIQAAGRAAGYTLREVGGGFCRYTEYVTNLAWEPWKFAQDSFGLMVDANISVVVVESSGRSCAFDRVDTDVVVLWDDHDGDRNAATMHAIMQAAIIKGMRT